MRDFTSPGVGEGPFCCGVRLVEKHNTRSAFAELFVF